MILYLIPFLLYFSFKDYTTIAVDTTAIVQTIKTQYTEINSKISVYRKIEKDVLELSAEGGTIIIYYDNEDLKKIISTFYGETGKAITEYYFNKSNLFFVFDTHFFYDKPIYIEGSKITSKEEDRYYFFQDQLLKWLNKNNQSINSNTKEYQNKERSILENLGKIKKIMQ